MGWTQYAEAVGAWGASFGGAVADATAKCNEIRPYGSTEATQCYISASTAWAKANNDTVVEDADVTPPTDPAEEDVNLEDNESSSSMLRSTTSIAATAISMVTAATVLVLA